MLPQARSCPPTPTHQKHNKNPFIFLHRSSVISVARTESDHAHQRKDPVRNFTSVPSLLMKSQSVSRPLAAPDHSRVKLNEIAPNCDSLYFRLILPPNIPSPFPFLRFWQ